RHLHRGRRYRAPGGIAGRAAGGMDRQRPDDDRGRARVWRAGRDDAGGGRPIRLFTRGVRRALGLSIRMDFAAGHPDRHYRRGRGGVRALPGRDVARVGLVSLAERRELRSLGRAGRRNPGDRVSDHHEPARPERRPDGAELVYDRQNSLPAAYHNRWMRVVSQCGRYASELRQRAHFLFERHAQGTVPCGFRRGDGRGLFSADAWASVTFAASEIRNPRRDLPRALAFGTGVVILLYVLTNLAYLLELPAAGVAGASDVFSRGIAHATSDRVAAAAMQVVWGGAGASFTAILVMISAFGCANGLILTGARVIYAMAEDRVFFAAARRLNGASVPAFALIIQGTWAAVLAVSGTYSDLLDYVIFAQLLFYVLTVGAVFVLRQTRPAAPRPYRAWGYPIVPAAYMVAAAALMIDLLVMKPRFTWPGLLIVLTGVPIYFMTTRKRP